MYLKGSWEKLGRNLIYPDVNFTDLSKNKKVAEVVISKEIKYRSIKNVNIHINFAENL